MARFVFDDEETAALETAGYLEAAGRYVPVLLNDIQQAMQSGGPDPAGPAILARISAPLLVLHGPDTRPFFTAAARPDQSDTRRLNPSQASGPGEARHP